VCPCPGAGWIRSIAATGVTQAARQFFTDDSGASGWYCRSGSRDRVCLDEGCTSPVGVHKELWSENFTRSRSSHCTVADLVSSQPSREDHLSSCPTISCSPSLYRQVQCCLSEVERTPCVNGLYWLTTASVAPASIADTPYCRNPGDRDAFSMVARPLPLGHSIAEDQQ
jgi:hypothetical protein